VWTNALKNLCCWRLVTVPVFYLLASVFPPRINAQIFAQFLSRSGGIILSRKSTPVVAAKVFEARTLACGCED